MKAKNIKNEESIDQQVRLIKEMLDIGQLVRHKRRLQELRIDDAAALTEVSVDLFSRLENGKGAVRLDKLLKVLDAMGLCMIVAPKNADVVRTIVQSHSANPERNSSEIFEVKQ